MILSYEGYLHTMPVGCCSMMKQTQFWLATDFIRDCDVTHSKGYGD